MDVEKRAEEIINDPNLNDFDNSMVDAIAALVREAVAEENENCAQLMEEYAYKNNMSLTLAHIIRSRLRNAKQRAMPRTKRASGWIAGS